MVTELDPHIPEAVRVICRRLRQQGKRAWIVGGCVRDLLLDRPVADFDICTNALPQEVQAMFGKVIPTGLEHGTVTVVLDRIHYEVTTLRGETTYSDGRRPDGVHFLDDIDADLARRDFTVNAIAYDPLDGHLVDPFGGQVDLRARTLRAVGDPHQRFAEDGLRILRGARFVATLEMQLDPATEAAMGPSLGTFARVSQERIREEWLKTMKAQRPSLAFQVMMRTGILGVCCPELVDQRGCPQNRYHAFDVWGHTLASLDAVPPGDPILRVAALLHDVGKPRTRAPSTRPGEFTFYDHDKIGAEMCIDLLERLRFSRQERDRITHLVRHHLVCYDPSWSSAAVRRWIQRIGTENLNDMREIARADALGKGIPVAESLALLDELYERVGKVLAKGQALSIKSLAVSGNDMMRELNIPPGKLIGQMLQVLLEHVIEHPDDNQRDTLLEIARRRQPELTN